MSKNSSPAPASTGRRAYLDYDLHGLVGIRLIGATPGDVAAVNRQLGPARGRLQAEPDIVLRFVPQLPRPALKFLALDNAGFTDDGFYVLRSSKRAACVRLDFTQLDGHCELVCESGLRSVPLLLQLIHLTMMRKQHLPVHASAFTIDGTGVLVTGWAKGGKSEALLAFALHGAEPVGDEWIYLSLDGERMYGIAEYMRLWDWHLAQLPHRNQLLGLEKRLLFAGIHFIDGVQAGLRKLPLVRGLAPVKYLHEALPALRRQLQITCAPAKIFGPALGSLSGRPDKVFLLVSHAAGDIRVEAADAREIARRMAASLQYEQLPLIQKYLEFKFAFPGRRSEFIETMAARHAAALEQALAGKEAYTVFHPYPCSFAALYEKMQPYCGRGAGSAKTNKAASGRRMQTQPLSG